MQHQLPQPHADAGAARQQHQHNDDFAGLISDLASPTDDTAASATHRIRLLAKCSAAYRASLSHAIPHLIPLLSSHRSAATVTHAVTALFNLTLRNHPNKSAVASSAGLAAISGLLKTKDAALSEARENAAALLCNIGAADDTPSDAADGLVSLLSDGSPRGKRDAAAALYNLLTSPRRRVRHKFRAAAVRAGAIPSLLELARSGVLVEESLALLLLLAAHQEGRFAILASDCGLDTVVALIEAQPAAEESGYGRIQEFAVSVLLVMCENDAAASDALHRIGAFEAVFRLSQSGGATERCRRTATQLLQFL